MSAQDDPRREMFDFSLMDAVFGRRSRRFGLGMEIPSGPLAFSSKAQPVPLSEEEQMLLVAFATGVSGWNFGVPFGPARPQSHAEFTLRFTGRTAPTAAGIGSPVLFFTDDEGCYVTTTRDVPPERMREFDGSPDDIERILALCRENTTRIRSTRLDLPSEPPHMLPPNLWMANAPGSTLFMPMGDASEEFFGILAIAVSSGAMVVDEETGEPAGDLTPFVRSGLLEEEKKMPLGQLQQDAYEANCLELAFMGHNMVLAMQAMGLGGLYYTGMDRWSVLGARSESGVEGLGFHFVEEEGSLMPNPVGLDGIYEALCPPYYPDMYAAAEAFAERKFGTTGAYDAKTEGPWKDSSGVKGSVTPYSAEFTRCLGEIAQYVYEKHGSFPGTRTTMVLPGYVQAQHIDTDYYDRHFKSGAYLATHGEHMQRWHGGD